MILALSMRLKIKVADQLVKKAAESYLSGDHRVFCGKNFDKRQFNEININ